MGKLSAKDQAFVRLYFGEGMAPEKIATELGISVKTVYSKKHKIGAKLEALLKELQASLASTFASAPRLKKLRRPALRVTPLKFKSSARLLPVNLKYVSTCAV